MTNPLHSLVFNHLRRTRGQWHLDTSNCLVRTVGHEDLCPLESVTGLGLLEVYDRYGYESVFPVHAAIDRINSHDPELRRTLLELAGVEEAP